MIFMGKPAANLTNQMDLCWSFERVGDDKKAVYEILPRGNMILMLRYSSFDCRSFLFGPVTTKTLLEIDETCSYFFIRFLPGQAPQLADVHPSELVNNCVELPKIFGVSSGSLGERLIFSPSHTSRQRIMEGLFRKTRPFVQEDRCRWGATLIEASGGRLSVNELACHLGVHVRSVERNFLDHFGMSPKHLIRIIRLQHFIAQKRFGCYRNFADLASVCGYSDQSHMIKDLKELTGRLPGELTSSYIRLVEPNNAIQVSYV
jgi:AraC-like DNA-binding protein